MKNQTTFKLPQFTAEQRMLLLLHEISSSQHYAMSKYEKPMDTQEQIKAKQKNYFDNFPFNEQATRDFLAFLKERGWFEKYDVMADSLSDILIYPNYSRGGFRILNVTVGKGVHNTNMYGGHELLDHNYEVNEGEVYITYNTTSCLSGGIFTAVMERKDGINKIIKEYTHSRS
jgi:hypothetical protein